MSDPTTPRFPYGRMAAIRFGFWSLAQGAVMMLSLGQWQPSWQLHSALKASHKAHRKVVQARSPRVVMRDPTPPPPSAPEIIHVRGEAVADALRDLADRFDADDDLVLISVWNIYRPELDYPEAYLQVIVKHLRPDGGSS